MIARRLLLSLALGLFAPSALAQTVPGTKDLPPLPPPPPPPPPPVLVPPPPPPADGTAIAVDATAAKQDAKDAAKKDDKKEEPKKDAFGFKRCAPQDSDAEFPRTATGCSGVIGLRVTVTGLDAPNTGAWVGAALYVQGEEYVRRDVFSVRTTSAMGLGGGGAGFEGVLDGSVAFGGRVPIAQKHGPVARVGIAGHVIGNDLFYSSLIELPQGQLAYQYMSGVTVVELGATIGLALDGRYGQRWMATPGVSPHTALGGLEVGGYAALQARHFRLGVQAQRVPIREAPGNVYMGKADFCAVGWFMATCLDVRVTSQDGLGLIGDPTRATYYGGVTFGFSRER